ncbi:MAG: hypothetical protein ACFCD0_19330 [Gemmataceae bacterium]
MDIQALIAHITEADLNNLPKKYLKDKHPIKDLVITIQEDNVVIKGKYKAIVSVKFETVWEPSVNEGKVRARLAKIKAFGTLPVTVLKTYLMRLCQSAIEDIPGISLDGDAMDVDHEELAREEGWVLACSFREVRCEPGRVVVVAGDH